MFIKTAVATKQADADETYFDLFLVSLSVAPRRTMRSNL